MKYDRIQIVGTNTVTLPFEGVNSSSPFVLKDASGLGPVERAVRYSKGAGTRMKFQEKTLASRQIALRIGLQPDWDVGQTAEELRSLMYGLLAPRGARLLRLQFIQDAWVPPSLPATTVRALIDGHISRMEPVLFTKDPEVQIVIDCNDSYFTAPSPVTTAPTKTPVGGGTGKANFIIDNYGSAPSPFWMRVVFNSFQGSPTRLDDGPWGSPQSIQVDGVTFTAGDAFTVDTRPGSRGVWKSNADGSGAVSLLNNLHPNSVWFELHSGVNNLVFNQTLVDFASPKGFEFLPMEEGV